MVQRNLFFRLEPPRQTPEGRRDAVEELRAGLSAGPRLRGLTIGVPADAPSEKSWDLSVALHFDDVQSASVFVADRQPFLDGWCASRAQVVKGWSFTAQ